MKRPRFTVRRLMVAIAVIAVLLAAVLCLNDRRRRFALLANDHGLKAIEEIKAKRPSRHRELYEKYIYAAHHPWLPVAPDPPEPK
jgi:hypothetical protein